MMSLLPLPQLDTSTVFYKRQLWVYTEDIHMIQKSKAHLYVWTEGTGNKGNKEIANILYLFIKQNKQIYFCQKRAIFWSDSTGSQNRCFTITAFFIWLVNNTELLEHVIHRFFIKGHSYMKCDQDFGILKKKFVSQRYIYNTNDYIKLMKTKDKFIVNEIKHSGDFLDYEGTLPFNQPQKLFNTDNERVIWKDIHEMIYEKGLIGFRYRYWFDDDFKTVKYKVKNTTRSAGRDIAFSTSRTLILSNATWKNKLLVSKEKFNDLQSLKVYIPEVYHKFYDNLPHTV